MANDIGFRIGVEGEKDFKNSIAEINRSCRVLGSEMKAVASQFEKGDSSVAALTARNEVLNKQIDTQKDKIETLKAALKNAADSFGETDKRTQDWQIQLNNAEAALRDMERELQNNKRDMVAAEDATNDESKALSELQEESEKTHKAFEVMGRGLKASVEIIVGAAAAVGTAFAAIGKQSIELYADYEQLVGGVETLFKDSSDIVKSYAADAYKTAGLSANEYMETVTGFSASLLQSLDGDTAKAAKIADMAIADMSDNANKMGSDISSIQNAYQGFAKQNYTMLDNLKLGYGGTKQEMERLLSDATKLSGVKYDINSLSDVYEAIHVIQNELGVTGTTAREASTTISGSLSAMKSSWHNLLIGVADDTQDFDKLIDNFVDGVTTFGKNIIPRVKIVISGVSKLISGFVEELLPEVLSELPDLISDLLPEILSSTDKIISSLADSLPTLLSTTFTTVIPKLTQSIMALLPKLAAGAIQVIKGLMTSISKALPQLMRELSTVIVELVKVFTDPESIRSMIEAGFELVKGLVEGILEALPQLFASVFIAIGNIVKSIYSIFDSGVLKVDNVIKGLDEVGDAFDELSDRAHNAINDVKDDITSITSSNGAIDELSEELRGLIEDGTIDPSEQAKAKTIVDLISDKVPDFQKTWDELIKKDDEGNISLRNNADLTIQKIDEVINAYKREAAQRSLNTAVSDLMEQSRVIAEEREKAEANLNLTQQHFNDALEYELSQKGLTLEDWKNYLNGVYDSAAQGTEEFSKLTKLSALYVDLTERGLMDSVADAHLAVNGLNISQRDLKATTQDYMGILRVMNGDYSDLSATLAAIEQGFVDQQDVLDKTGMTWDEFKKKASEAMSNADKSAEESWSNMRDTLSNGAISWQKYGDEVAFVISGHEYTLNDLKNITKDEFKQISSYFNTSDWTNWGDESTRVKDIVSESLGSMYWSTKDSMSKIRTEFELNQFKAGQAINMTSKLIEGIFGKVDTGRISQEGTSLWRKTILGSFGGGDNGYSDFQKIGISIVDGLTAGINAGRSSSSYKNTLMNFAQESSDYYRRVNMIQSPSKVFKELGKFDVEGLIEGHNEMYGEAVRSVQRIADGVSGVSFSLGSLSGISEYRDSIGIRESYMNPPSSILVNVQFGDVRFESDRDIYDVADQISDVIAEQVMVKARRFS